MSEQSMDPDATNFADEQVVKPFKSSKVERERLRDALTLVLLKQQEDLFRWSQGSGAGSNELLIRLPSLIYEPEVGELVATLSDMDACPDFDWMNWSGQAKLYDVKSVWAAPLADVLRRVTTIVRGEQFHEGTIAEALDSGVLVALCFRLLQAGTYDDGPHGKASQGERFVFWAECRAIAVDDAGWSSYSIYGYGSVSYRRNSHYETVGLYRYDRDKDGFPGGAILTPQNSTWMPTETPDRVFWRGSDEPGKPITGAQAEEIIVALGHPKELLEDPWVQPTVMWPHAGGHAATPPELLAESKKLWGLDS